MLKRDPDAQGLVFFGGNEPSPFLALRYVSKSEDAGKRFVQMQADWFHVKDTSRMAPMNQIAADCVESRTRINVPPAELDGKPLTTLSEEMTGLCMGVMYLPWLGFSCPKVAMENQ